MGLFDRRKMQRGEDLYARGWALYEKKDYAGALPLFQEGAKLGNASAQNDLGVMHERGFGVDANDRLAFQWYLAAAEQGHPTSKFKVAIAYTNGKCVMQDLEKAFKWFSEAAEEGNANSMSNLANFYLYGYYVGKDLKKAEEWALRAVEAGGAKAKELLDEIRSEMTRLR